MEKLELKHLAPYLPYGLRFMGKKKDWVNSSAGAMTLCVIDLDGRFDIIKPILRPLSDLTKEMDCPEVMGERIIYIKKLSQFLYEEEPDSFDQLQGAEKWIELMTNDYMNLPYKIIQELFEWHFDVFGLIEKGLAIDINTL